MSSIAIGWATLCAPLAALVGDSVYLSIRWLTIADGRIDVARRGLRETSIANILLGIALGDVIGCAILIVLVRANILNISYIQNAYQDSPQLAWAVVGIAGPLFGDRLLPKAVGRRPTDVSIDSKSPFELRGMAVLKADKKINSELDAVRRAEKREMIVAVSALVESRYDASIQVALEFCEISSDAYLINQRDDLMSVTSDRKTKETAAKAILNRMINIGRESEVKSCLRSFELGS